MIWRTSTEKYKNISNGNSNIIGENNKNIHDTLVKKQATQLHYMIEWAREYNLIDISDTFRDVHKKQIIPKEREISYRLTLTQHQSPATPMQKNKQKHYNYSPDLQTKRTRNIKAHMFRMRCNSI